MLDEKPLVSTQSVDFLDLQRSSWFTSPRGARDSCKVIFIATPPLWLILAGRPEVGAVPVQGRPSAIVLKAKTFYTSSWISRTPRRSSGGGNLLSSHIVGGLICAHTPLGKLPTDRRSNVMQAKFLQPVCVITRTGGADTARHSTH